MHKWIPFNVNHNVRVKLTDEGRNCLREINDDLFRGFPELASKYTPPTEDADGWSEWQLWELMQKFGDRTRTGRLPMFETSIEIEVEQSQ